VKFEKLNDNKIRIILTTKDLNENHIDCHSFMSNSVETQDLFLDMLEKAEEEIGFITKDYKIRIDALAMSDGDFILTVTRMLPETNIEKKDISRDKSLNKCKIKVKRKEQNLQKEENIAYRFLSFDDFYDFVTGIHSSNLDLKRFATSTKLYSYENALYLIFKNINIEHENIKKLSSYITEFASYVNNSDVFISKIVESGKLVIKNNAITIALKHFLNT